MEVMEFQLVFFCSFPVICLGDGKYEIVKNLKISESIKKRIDISVEELKKEKQEVIDKIKK